MSIGIEGHGRRPYNGEKVLFLIGITSSRVHVCNVNPEFRRPRLVEKYQVQVTNLNPQEKKGGYPPSPPRGGREEDV
jgi:hypothetical protein